MFLLDSNCADRMDRGTPQRKTVYRISLTLVKKEDVEDEGGGGGGGAGPRRADNLKVGAFRRDSSVEMQRSGLLEQLKEVEDESDDLSASHSCMRNFRTFSTGQLELGRLKISRKHQLKKELKQKLPEPGREHPESRQQEVEDPDRPEELCTDSADDVEDGSKKKKLMNPKSPEPLNRDGRQCKSNGKTAKVSPETPPPKQPPGLLRRSFSFRHWTGGELLRLQALTKDKHHSSSGCLGRDAAAGTEKQAEAAGRHHNHPTRQKSRTLEVGAILNKTDSMSELSRWERARGGKNRTLDNSDLQCLAAEKDGSGFLLRGGGGRSSERRLVRFFSGIFSRRDGASTSTSTPLGSPSTNRSLRRTRRTLLSQSSTESMNGGSADGKQTCVLSCDPCV